MKRRRIPEFLGLRQGWQGWQGWFSCGNTAGLVFISSTAPELMAPPKGKPTNDLHAKALDDIRIAATSFAHLTHRTLAIKTDGQHNLMYVEKHLAHPDVRSTAAFRHTTTTLRAMSGENTLTTMLMVACVMYSLRSHFAEQFTKPPLIHTLKQAVDGNFTELFTAIREMWRTDANCSRAPSSLHPVPLLVVGVEHDAEGSGTWGKGSLLGHLAPSAVRASRRLNASDSGTLRTLFARKRSFDDLTTPEALLSAVESCMVSGLHGRTLDQVVNLTSHVADALKSTTFKLSAPGPNLAHDPNLLCLCSQAETLTYLQCAVAQLQNGESGNLILWNAIASLARERVLDEMQVAQLLSQFQEMKMDTGFAASLLITGYCCTNDEQAERLAPYVAGGSANADDDESGHSVESSVPQRPAVPAKRLKNRASQRSKPTQPATKPLQQGEGCNDDGVQQITTGQFHEEGSEIEGYGTRRDDQERQPEAGESTSHHETPDAESPEQEGNKPQDLWKYFSGESQHLPVGTKVEGLFGARTQGVAKSDWFAATVSTQPSLRASTTCIHVHPRHVYTYTPLGVQVTAVCGERGKYTYDLHYEDNDREAALPGRYVRRWLGTGNTHGRRGQCTVMSRERGRCGIPQKHKCPHQADKDDTFSLDP